MDGAWAVRLRSACACLPTPACNPPVCLWHLFAQELDNDDRKWHTIRVLDDVDIVSRPPDSVTVPLQVTMFEEQSVRGGGAWPPAWAPGPGCVHGAMAHAGHLGRVHPSTGSMHM